jgi:MerR family transcriptional regulator, redox-sensitive transcriptional activator SoxR
MERFTIGEVARRTGLRASAIRYYESIGLIPAPGRSSGQRRYGSDVFTKLAIVRMAQDAGFTIEEIRTLVAGFPVGTPAGDRWRELAGRKLPEVEARIERLTAVRNVLEESLACGCLTLDACAAVGWRQSDEISVDDRS